MKNLINWLKKRVFLTRIELFPKYRIKTKNKIINELQNSTIEYIEKNTNKSKYPIINDLIKDLITTGFHYNFFFALNLEKIENELQSLEKQNKLDFLDDFEQNFKTSYKKYHEKLYSLFPYTGKDENNYIMNKDMIIGWINSKRLEYTIPNYENFYSYELSQKIIDSFDLNNIVFIVKNTFENVKNKKEYKLWINSEIKKTISILKNHTQPFKKNETFKYDKIANMVNRLEFALKTINELDITENNTIKENRFVEKFTNFKNQNISITEHNKTEPLINKQNKNPYLEIFSNENYQLFEYINKEYKRDNNALKAKYSNIYHFMKYENCISGTQLMYINFIKKKFGIKLSRIIPETYKYKDEIQPLLTRLKNQFNQNKQH